MPCRNWPQKSGLILLLVIFSICAFFTLFFGKNSYEEDLHFAIRFSGMSWDFPLGLDAIGRDYSTRVVRAFSATLLVAGLASLFLVLVALLVFIILLALPEYFKKVGLSLIKVLVALPSFLPLIVLALYVDALSVRYNLSEATYTELDIMRVALLIGFSHWGSLSLILHEAWREVQQSEFVLATQAMGGSRSQSFIFHGFSALRERLFIYFLQNIPNLIMAETMLSFLGLGLRDPNLSLGGLMIDGVGYLQKAPHLSLAPALLLGVIMLGFSLFRKRQNS